MSKPLTDWQVIQKVGIDALTAHGYTEFAVRKWMNSDRGIPWEARPKVMRLAKSKGIRLPADFLEQRRLPSSEAA